MGRIKKYFYSFTVTASVLALILLGGCGSQAKENDTAGPKTQTKEQTTQTEKKDSQDIPDELLPGGDSTEEQGVLDASGEENDTSSGENQKDTGNRPQENENVSKGAQESSKMQVSVSVDSSVVGNIVSCSGSVTLDKGATVYDALVALVGSQVTGSGSYVTGIGGLSEKDYGSKSGWMYKVNGEAPNKGSGKYELSDGDVVVWSYTK